MKLHLCQAHKSFLRLRSSQQDDLHRFTKDSALTALMYNQRRKAGTLRLWNEDQYSIRGLEDAVRTGGGIGVWIPHTKAGSAAKTKDDLRDAHVKAVLEEQRRLRLLDGDRYSNDSLALAELSAKSSHKSWSRAVALAKADATAGYRCSSMSPLGVTFRAKILHHLPFSAGKADAMRKNTCREHPRSTTNGERRV